MINKLLKYLVVVLTMMFSSCSSQQEPAVEEDTCAYQILAREDIQDSIDSLPKDTIERVNAILNRISKDRVVCLSSGVGYAGAPTIQYEYTNHLLSVSSPKQLRKIAIKHPSPIVRAAVFSLLSQKYPHEAVEVAIRGMNDTTWVETISGCCGGDEPLNVMRVNNIIINRNCFKDSDINRLDSIVLFSHNVQNMDAYGHLFKSLMPKERYYHRLKSLYDKKCYTAPIIAIAKYDTEDSRNLLMDLLKDVKVEEESMRLSNALIAISYCPNKCFKDYVKRIANSYLSMEKDFSDGLYSAIMAYEEPWTISLIESSMRKNDSSWDLYCAYREHPRSYYKALYNKYCSRYN